MPVIPAAWEVEIRRLAVPGQPQGKLVTLHLNKQARYGGSHL
jgi:hypothetical protein